MTQKKQTIESIYVYVETVEYGRVMKVIRARPKIDRKDFWFKSMTEPCTHSIYDNANLM